MIVTGHIDDDEATMDRAQAILRECAHESTCSGFPCATVMQLAVRVAKLERERDELKARLIDIDAFAGGR
jgi:hypothetical protein